MHNPKSAGRIGMKEKIGQYEPILIFFGLLSHLSLSVSSSPLPLCLFTSLSLSLAFCVFCSVCLSVCLPWFIYLNIHSDPQSNARSKIKKFKKNGPVVMAWVNVDVRRNIVWKTLFTKDFFYIYLFLDE